MQSEARDLGTRRDSAGEQSPRYQDLEIQETTPSIFPIYVPLVSPIALCQYHYFSHSSPWMVPLHILIGYRLKL